jgi:SdrD B-like domain
MMSVLSFLRGKSKGRKTHSGRQRSKWTKSFLNLESLETRALPSQLTFTATNFDFTTYSGEAVATPSPIPQFDTMGGTRTLVSVEIISDVRLDAAVSASVSNHSGSTATYTASITNTSVSVDGTGFTSPLTATSASLLSVGPISCPNNATTTISPVSASLTGHSDFTLTGLDLLPFIGSGDLSYTNSADAVANTSTGGGSNINNNTTFTTTGEATVEVIYTFVTNPTLVTTASQAITLGTSAPTLTDSAVLAGGFDNPGGTITFTLVGPGGFTYTQTDTVNGNGTYTAGTTLPTSGTVAGTYTWSAHYSGDDNNTSADDQGGTEEQTVVSPASPNLLTIASSAVTLGTSAPTLTDAAFLTGGYFETGSITFVLVGPGGFSYTQTDTVNGNGTYTAGTTLGTSGQVAGTYTWSASYTGDDNNASAIDQGGTAEQTVVSPAHPNLVTTANPAIATLGTSGAALTDSAVLSGGFHETGTITFVLSGPGGFTYTQTDTVNGNGTYTAGTTLTAGAATGTYIWSANFSGDGNNSTAIDQGGRAEQTEVGNPVVAPAMFRMTGGGSIFLPEGGVPGAGIRVTHGFELHCTIDANNHLEINWDKSHFHLQALTSIICLDDPNINPPPPPSTNGLGDTMIGVGTGRFTGTFNGVSYKNATATVEFTFTDAGEPGTSDTASYRITVNGTVVLDTLGSINLTFGNHQVHPELKNLIPAAAAIQQQIANTFISLDSSTLSAQMVSSLTEDLLAQFAAQEAALRGATIFGLAFLDSNHNGIQDLGERGLAGLTVQLYGANGHKFAQAKTDANGFYEFKVPAGQYSLAFATPTPKYHFSSAAPGSDSVLSSKVGSNGRTSLFTTLSDQLLAYLNAGMYL